jgi:predicted P-loop ATPase
VPKYKEFSDKFKRRLVMYGTTNRDDFLGDETGERRWLPFEVDDKLKLRVEELEQDREQLWAEAVTLWKQHGVMWQDAERLAAAEHGKYKGEDPWTAPVVRWLLEEDELAGGAPVDREYQWGTNEVLIGALGRKVGELRHADQMRVGAILRGLGCWKKRVRGKGWVYRAFREQLAENAS